MLFTNHTSSSFRYEEKKYVIMFYALYLFYQVIKMFISIIDNRNSRLQKIEADHFASENDGLLVLQSALIKVNFLNLMNPKPSSMDKLLNYSHPPLSY